jgi:cation transport ATPase
VLPWVSATTQARRRNGDAVVAGARVVRGKLRGICTFAGNDRAFARVLLDPRRRADALAPVAHAARSLAEVWAIAAAIVGGIISVVARRSPIEVVMTAVAVHAALATALIAAVPSVHVLRGILLGLRRGIVYKSADAWDRAGRVVMAMFCARGTLLLGEPEVAELEAIGPRSSRTTCSPSRRGRSGRRSTPSRRPSCGRPGRAAFTRTASGTRPWSPASA